MKLIIGQQVKLLEDGKSTFVRHIQDKFFATSSTDLRDLVDKATYEVIDITNLDLGRMAPKTQIFIKGTVGKLEYIHPVFSVDIQLLDDDLHQTRVSLRKMRSSLVNPFNWTITKDPETWGKICELNHMIDSILEFELETDDS